MPPVIPLAVPALDDIGLRHIVAGAKPIRGDASNSRSRVADRLKWREFLRFDVYPYFVALSLC